MNRRTKAAAAASRFAAADYYEWEHHVRIWFKEIRARAMLRYVHRTLPDPVWNGPAALRALMQLKG